MKKYKFRKQNARNIPETLCALCMTSCIWWEEKGYHMHDDELSGHHVHDEMHCMHDRLFSRHFFFACLKGKDKHFWEGFDFRIEFDDKEFYNKDFHNVFHFSLMYFRTCPFVLMYFKILSYVFPCCSDVFPKFIVFCLSDAFPDVPFLFWCISGTFSFHPMNLWTCLLFRCISRMLSFYQ